MAAAIPLALLTAIPSSSLLQFLLGAAWAGLALTAVVLLQERRNALDEVADSVKHRIKAIEKGHK